MGLTDMVRILWTSIAGGKKLKGGVAMENPARMNFIAELVAAGKLKPVIDRSYPLGANRRGLQVRRARAQEGKCRDHGGASMSEATSDVIGSES